MATRDFLTLQRVIRGTLVWRVRFLQSTAIQPDPTQRHEVVAAGDVRSLPTPLARDLQRQGLIEVIKEQRP